MMRSHWGNNLKLCIYGGSHDPYIGGILTGFPAGIPLDEKAISALMRRRAPGSALTTPRKEADIPQILSGFSYGEDRVLRSNGDPIEIHIESTNRRSGDYGEMVVPRPSHADYPAYIKYGGQCDLRGGGHFSGRLTAPLTFFGALCMTLLEQKGITIGAHLLRVGNAFDRPFDPMTVCEEDFRRIREASFPCLDGGEAIQAEIRAAAADGDSIGAIVECAAIGLPVGIGSHMFRGVEGVLSSLLYGIPAVKGVEFGDGFAFSSQNGSTANDGYEIQDGSVALRSNHCGGIIGGMTSSAPLLLRCAFKPTPSIFKEQPSVNLKTMQNESLRIVGRHDPCVAIRAVPVVEAATAIGLLELMLDAEEA